MKSWEVQLDIVTFHCFNEPEIARVTILLLGSVIGWRDTNPHPHQENRFYEIVSTKSQETFQKLLGSK